MKRPSVIAVDARNHGDSPHTSDMSYKDMAEDIIHLMHDLGLEKALLVGHSMGGSAMMYTALNYPHNVEKLVVVDMSPVSASPNLLQMTTIFEAMRSVNVDGSPNLSKARQMVNKQFARFIKPLALRQFLAANLVEVDSGKYKWRVNLPVLEQAFSTQIAVFPNVGRKIYLGPTLFIGGGNSDYIRLKDHNAIRTLFHRAEFHYINGANHWVHADNPVEFLNILTNFINRPLPS
ncbi:protein ABHD11-like isoform X2 [Odontomachus brunneus]|uniref:protein ABHD11-like isoform X2 n=1 Tax=Odontomachus brunneus TaxID=486640 RepID=UPI0013F23DE0|nr:protein ABHD11-like isoform X2 [Odontomachus brunneus]